MGQLYSHLVFRPPVPSYESYDGRMSYVVRDDKGEPIVKSSELIWLRTALGAHIPGAWVNRHLAASKHVILFAHSNGDDLANAMVEAHRLSTALDVAVFAFDYTGYGISEIPPPSSRFRPAARKNCKLARKNATPNTSADSSADKKSSNTSTKVAPSLTEEDRARATPSEFACYADIHAAYTYLVRDVALPSSNIILVGRSIGSGPVVHCAARNACGGVVLVAPIASAVRVALQRVNVTVPFLDTFANIDKVSRIRCPVLVVHGDDDELVPIRHAKLLLRKATTAVEPLFVPSAAHNNVVEDNQSLVFRRCRGFLREVQDATRGSEPITIRRSHDIGVGLLHYANTLKHQVQAAKRAAPTATNKGNNNSTNSNSVDLPRSTAASAPVSEPRRCFPLKRKRTRGLLRSQSDRPDTSTKPGAQKVLPAHLSTYAKASRNASLTTMDAPVAVPLSKKNTNCGIVATEPLSKQEQAAIERLAERRTVCGSAVFAHVDEYDDTVYRQTGCHLLYPSAANEDMSASILSIILNGNGITNGNLRTDRDSVTIEKEIEIQKKKTGGFLPESAFLPPSRRVTLPPLTQQVMHRWAEI